ncbi:UNVERIFIED_CONTAM: hypothetical protein Sradi_4999700 [Sesamum radiatum]|uniref:Uncharacterized protein n=1 Tax=Sesamum radiatum TaxID=300843 RepID=A0AAW2MHJ8_SESRA
MDHKDLIVTLQNEISNLNVSLMSMTEERNKLEEENKSIFSEYEKKSHELEDVKISEAGVQGECSKAVDDLKEATFRINQLTEENKILNADLELHKFKVKEPDQKKLSSQFEEVANRGVETNISLLQKPKSDITSLEQLKVDEFNDSFGFIALKWNLEDAEIVMQKLEKEIANMHFQSTSSSRVDKVAAPAVSRLIHTFESKGHADSQDPENPPSEYQTTEDSYTRTKMATENLRVLLRKLLDDAANACELFRVMQSKLITDAAGRDRNEYNSLREHTDQVEEANIELMVLCEAMKDNIYHAVAKEGELLSLCDFLQKQELVLKSENTQLRGKLNDFQAKISELQSQLDGISRDSGEIASISNQVQTLLAEVADRESILEEEWNSVFAQVGRDSNLDVVGCVAASVDQASEVIEGLRGQLEAAQGNCREISDKHDMALNTLQRLYDELSELVRTSGLRLETENKQLNAELITRAREIDELDKKCLKSDAFMKLVEKIEQSVSLEGTEMDADEPVSRLESLINQLVQKYEEASLGLSLSTSLEKQLTDLRGQVEHLNSVILEYENENLVSGKRVSSLREKLSIAVTKGKGLISQRDGLKQSLAETSKELEKCSQELLSKDARLRELETKLKVYSEAENRRNIRRSRAARALPFPNEKIDWLAKSVGGNSLPLGDWDRRGAVGGGSYTDAGFVGVEGLKEDIQANPDSGDDLRRRYEELQNKFYGLAEHNEMLEQSLRERNNLVLRWEEILDRVLIPSQLRSMEPEDKIQWLQSTLSEAQNHCNSLQQKINNLENFCASLTADVEDSQRTISELEVALHQAGLEKETLSKDLEMLSQDNKENSKKAADFKIQNENLQYEISILQEKKLQLEEEKEILSKDLEILSQENEENSKKAADFKFKMRIFNMKILPRKMVISQEGFKYFEEMLKKLIENYKGLSSEKAVYVDPIDEHVSEKGELSQTGRDSEDVERLSKKLEDSMGELMLLKEEKDQCMLNNQSLLRDVEELEIKKKELQDLLNHEEQKSASLREKLNLAVTKGRSLVQQRDGMKQVIQELNAEVERLKSDAKLKEKAISEYEEQIKSLCTAQERVQVMESENTSLRDRLAETERCLQEKEGSWSSILHALDDIDIGLASNSGSPIEKLMEIGKYLHDQRSGMDALAQESRKSKRAAELLLAELNEVQERNDGLQEELAKAVQQLSELSREKDLAENDKFEALAHVEKLSYIHSEEKNRQLSEIMMLKSGVDNMREDLSAIERELADVLSKDLEVLHSVKTMIKSFSESGGSPDMSALFPSSFPGGLMSRAPENKVFMTEIGSLRQQLHNHSHLLQEEASWLSEVVMNVHREYTSHKESCESMKNAISEIENWKEHVGGNALASRSPERNLKSQVRIEGGNSFTDNIFNEEGVRGTGDKLLLVVRDLISMQSELLEVGQREMKSTILNLQKELQEKDIQETEYAWSLLIR